MNNLIRNMGRSDTRYKYNTVRCPDEVGAKVKSTKVEVYYTKGGKNPFRGGTTRRGVWVAITPVELERNEGYVGERFLMFAGTGDCLLELKALSARKLDLVAERLDPVVPEAARLFDAGDEIGAFKALRDAVGVV